MPRRGERGEVFEAWVSGDLPRMLRASDMPASVVDRHFLLLSIVRALYPERLKGRRELFESFCETHLRELPGLMAAVMNPEGGLLHVPTFEMYARSLAELGRFEQAQEVWLRATAEGFGDFMRGDPQRWMSFQRRAQQRRDQRPN